MNQECQLLFFCLREISSSENQSLPWTSRGIQVKYLPMMLSFIHRHYVLNYPIFYDQCALSPQSSVVRNLYIFRTDLMDCVYRINVFIRINKDMLQDP